MAVRRRPVNRDAAEARLLHECFDGGTCRGLGASHQTGWIVRIVSQPNHRPQR